ncbi:hypothetical protein J6590_027762 [Homalodisca vitripennis]|nr:hypothetical protein J6590_027762 [Homalodisca vitripennis]
MWSFRGTTKATYARRHHIWAFDGVATDCVSQHFNTVRARIEDELTPEDGIPVYRSATSLVLKRRVQSVNKAIIPRTMRSSEVQEDERSGDTGRWSGCVNVRVLTASD